MGRAISSSRSLYGGSTVGSFNDSSRGRRGVETDGEHFIEGADLVGHRGRSLGSIGFTVFLVKTSSLTLITGLGACGRSLCTCHLLLLGKPDLLLAFLLALLVSLHLGPGGQNSRTLPARRS
jgi:hypothetical protein